LAVGGNEDSSDIIVRSDMGNSSMPFWRRDIKTYKVSIEFTGMFAVWSMLAHF
jgi:hypothetical protein